MYVANTSLAKKSNYKKSIIDNGNDPPVHIPYLEIFDESPNNGPYMNDIYALLLCMYVFVVAVSAKV